MFFFGTKFLEVFFKSPEQELSLGEAAKFAVGPLLGNVDTVMNSHETLTQLQTPIKNQNEQKAGFNSDWIRNSITTPSQLEWMFGNTKEVVDDYMRKFEKRQNLDFDVFKEMYNLVVTINIRCFVGQEISEHLDEVVHLLWAIEYYGTTIYSLFNPLSSYRKKSVEARLRLVEIIGLIRERRMENIKNGTHDGSRDVLQVNIEMGRNNEQIAAAILSIFFAAQTNTVSTSAWTLAYLSTHPEWQNKVRAEIPDGELTYEQLKELPTLGACLSETVRKNALAFVFRKALKNITIDGLFIRKGDYCVVSPSVVHANESLYPEPESWNPDRFLQDGKNYKTAALKYGKNFIQWGFYGHRCLGEQFALIVMKLIITNFVRRYQISTKDALELDFSKVLGMPFNKQDIIISTKPMN